MLALQGLTTVDRVIKVSGNLPRSRGNPRILHILLYKVYLLDLVILLLVEAEGVLPPPVVDLGPGPLRQQDQLRLVADLTFLFAFLKFVFTGEQVRLLVETAAFKLAELGGLW